MALAETPILIAGETIESSRPRYDVDALLALSDDDSPVEDRIRAHLQGPDLRRLDRPAEADPRPASPGVVLRSPPAAPAATALTREDVMVMPGPLYHNGPVHLRRSPA